MRDADNIHWALKNIDLEINQGDAIGIIGRNGAGKSTLLKILSRITEPSLGQIKVRGRLSSLLEVGTGFNPELTGQRKYFSKWNHAWNDKTRNQK
jgi:lipopolysaccharide transport system ATP-binding protein